MSKQQLSRMWWRVAPSHRHQIHPWRQSNVFSSTPRPHETAEQMIARQLARARPFELGWLFMLRTSENADVQVRALTLMQQARSVFWSRIAVMMAGLSLPIAIFAAILSR
jgi:hypothetical protein